MGQLVQAVPRDLRLGQSARLHPSVQVGIVEPDVCFGEPVGNGERERDQVGCFFLGDRLRPRPSSGDGDSVSIILVSSSIETSIPWAHRSSLWPLAMPFPPYWNPPIPSGHRP